MMSSLAWAGDVTVSDVWARASAGGAGAGAVFMTIKNAGQGDDKLVTVSTPVSKVAELHTHSEVDGVMTMRKVPEIAVGGGKSVELKPGGFHIMLMGLTTSLKEGDTFPVTLNFEKAGEVNVMANVGGVAAMGGGHHMDHHMGDDHH